MIENKWHKKEKPMLTMSGLGGGLFQQVLASASEPIYVDDVFSTFLWEGNSTNSRAIANGIDLSGKGGLTWIKLRSGTDNHILYDTERGGSNFLSSDLTAAENSNDGLTFNSNGFTIAVNSQAYTNANGSDYCSWTFRKCPKFFDIVTFSGNSTAGREISHSLGSTPGMVIVKRRDAASSKWAVWHTSYGDNNRLYLNETSAGSPNQTNHIRTASSTTFTVGADYDVNVSGGTYVAYIFGNNDDSFGEDSDEAVIKCGGYTGAGTGLSVNVGFEPQWLMIKKVDSTEDWCLFDNMRGVVSGENDARLSTNNNYNENINAGEYIRFTPIGFQVDSGGNPVGSIGSNYIYMAIRRPHKPPESGTDVFALDTSDNTRTNGMEFNAGFAVDWYFYASATGNGNRFLSHRLASGRELNINTAGSDSSATTSEMDSTDGCHNGSLADGGFIARMWKRAPGFCDVVNYTGNAIDRSVEHNLGVVPEMMIVKNRQKNTDWYVYHKEMTTTHAVYWNDNDAEFSTTVWYTNPVASVFYVSSAAALNDNGDSHIALLFATRDGVSKVGSYSGTGNDLNVDCGFTAGARFVMIKRIDASGHWHQFDTEQGINSGDEPFLLLNGTTRTTGQDYIDPLNAGFTITSAAPDDINASGGTYIFLAIA